MDERKFGRILETGMGAIMSFTLNLSAMILLGATKGLNMAVMIGWVNAFAIAVAINYFCPVMDWVAKFTHTISNKTVEYIVRVFIFAFIEILFNSVWCLSGNGILNLWPTVFIPLWAIGTVAIFIALPIMVRVAGALAKTK